MTANQINFYKAKKEAAHYKRSDKEQKRHNVATEGIDTQKNLLTEWYNRKQADIGYGNMQANQYQADVAGQRAQIESRKQTLEEQKEYGTDWGNPVSYQLKAAERDKTLYEAANEVLKGPKLEAETGLIKNQSLESYSKSELAQEQSKTEQSKRVANYGRSVSDTVKALSGVYRIVDGVIEKVADSVPGEVSVLHPD